MTRQALPRILVAICTYQRPELLSAALDGLTEQDGRQSFTWSARVVDNDKDQSARRVVEEHCTKGDLFIEYLVEPMQNISAARNRAVAGLNADYIAMIDDDERPEKDWLWHLWSMMQTSKADGVLGPVHPFYPSGCPAWLRESGLCVRPVHRSGSELEYHETRTGNTLLRGSLFREESAPFNVEFGRGGGEDIDFFRRKVKEGHRFVWCNEAAVYETVPVERWSLSYYCRRRLRLGGLLGHRQRRARELSVGGVTRSVASLLRRLVQFVVLLPFGKKRYSLPLVASCYHLGYLSAASGIVFLTEREELKCQPETIVSQA